MPSALLQRLAEEDETLLAGRETQIDGLMVERLYQLSWPVRYVPFPMLFGAFVLFRDYATWWSIVGLTALYTFGTWYLDRQRSAMQNVVGHLPDPAAWGWRFAFGSALTGLTWGLLCFLYFPAGDAKLQAVMAVAWAGLSSSSLNSRSTHLPSYYAFLLAMSVPIYLRGFLSGELPVIYMLLLGLVLATAMSLVAHNSNRRERLRCALRLRNAELIAELDRARAAAEANHAELEQAYHAILSEFTAAQQIAGHGSWTWDGEAGRLSWSDEFYRLIGLVPQSRPASLAGLLEQVAAADRDAVRRHYQRLRDGAARDEVSFALADPARQGLRLQAIGQAERRGADGAVLIHGILRAHPRDQSTA